MIKDKSGFEKSSFIFWNKKVRIFWIAISGLVVYFLYVSIGKTLENNDVDKYGIETNAIVIDMQKVGSKGVIRCTYTFEVNNVLYFGSVDDDYYKKGDTIQILYLKKNPEINRDKKFIKKIHD